MAAAFDRSFRAGAPRTVLIGTDCPTLTPRHLAKAFDALQIRMQQTPLGAVVPYQVFLMVPYVLSIAALVLMSRRAEVPESLMVPYNRGER